MSSTPLSRSPFAFLQSRTALALLRLGSEVLGKLPRRDDTIPELIAKGLALADTANKIFGSRDARYRHLTEHGQLLERTSETFARLFFATTMKGGFTITRIAVDERLDFLEAAAPSGEKLLFQEHRYGTSPEVDPTFFHTPGFDFAAAVNRLWATSPHGLLLTSAPGKYSFGHETKVTPLPAVAAEVQSSKARARLNGVIAAHRGFAQAGLHRGYLLFGPRGTGKTSFATHFARAFGGRLLQVDASALPTISTDDLSFLLDTLRPGFLVVNDIDRAPIEAVSARMLFLLEMVKASHRGTTILLTVNDPTKLDSAMLRSGRIDIPVEFQNPDKDERREILHLLAPGLAAETVATVIDASGGWTHAYLADLAQRLAALRDLEEPAEAIAAVRKLWALAEASEKANQAPSNNAPTPMSTTNP